MNEENEFGYLNIGTSLYKTRISKKFKNRKAFSPANPKIILSFIPGTITEIFVADGQSVSKGDDLLILDAMKMQNRLKCNVNGRIKTVAVKKGDKVSKGSVLIELK